MGKNKTTRGKSHPMAVDVPKHGKNKKTLQPSGDYYKSLIENSSDAIVVLDGDGIISYASPSIKHLLGYESTELADMKAVELAHPEDKSKLTDEFARLIKSSGATASVEVRAKVKDGTWRVVEITIKNLLEDKNVEGIVVNFHDINELKQIEEALVESEKRYRLIAEKATDVVFVTDMNFQPTYVSPSIEYQGGFTAEEAMTRPMEKVFTPTSLDLAIRVLDEEFALEDKENADLLRTRTEEYEVYCKDGSTMWTEWKTSFIRDENGSPIGLIGISRDISERKQMEQDLRIKENALENSLNAVAMSDLKGKITYVNQACLELWGNINKEELVGKPYWVLLSTDDDAVIKEIATSMLEKGSWEGELIGRAVDGKEINIHVYSGIVKDNGGNPIQTISSFIDITDRKKAEQALRESEERYRLLANNIMDVIFTLDMNLNFTYFSPSVEHSRGYTPEEATSMTIQESMTPESVETCVQTFIEEIAIEQQDEKDISRTRNIEIEMYHRDGSTFWVELQLTFIRDEDSNPLGIIGVSRNINERRQEREAQNKRTQEIIAIQKITASIQSTLELREVLQLISEAVVLNMGYNHLLLFLTDEKKNVTRGTVFHSSGGSKLVGDIEDAISQTLTSIEIPMIKGYSKVVDNGLERKATIAHHLYEIAEPPFNREECDALQDLTESRTIVNVPFYAMDKHVGNMVAFTSKDGISEEEMEILWLLADQAAIAIENAQLNEYLERRVVERTAQLQAANKELEKFAYSIAHDLRTPLRGIDGFSQVLLEDYNDALDDEGRDHLQRVRSASQRMSGLIDDILRLLHLTRSEMHIETVELSALVRTIADELKQQQTDRQVEFIITTEPVIQGDPQLLKEALSELIGNAWKFTSKQEDTKIEFGCTEINGQFTYFIRDNGIGFDMNYVSKIFTAFQRLHSMNEFGGAGIGLAKVQSAIHRHGGEIWAESAMEQGATFYFTLWSEEDQQDHH